MHELNSCNDGSVSRKICAAKMASARIAASGYFCPKQSPWKLLAQFSLSRERDVANIIA